MEVVLQALQQFLDVGIVGSVAVLAMFVAWKKDKRADVMQEQLLQSQVEHAKQLLAVEQRNSERIQSILKESNQALLALTAQVDQLEAELEPPP